MNTPITLPRNVVRALPEEPVEFHTDDGILVVYIEPSKNPSDPYLTIRYEFQHTIPPLKTAQRN